MQPSASTAAPGTGQMPFASPAGGAGLTPLGPDEGAQQSDWGWQHHRQQSQRPTGVCAFRPQNVTVSAYFRLRIVDTALSR